MEMSKKHHNNRGLRVKVAFIYADPMRGDMIAERSIRVDRILPQTKENIRNFVALEWQGEMIHMELMA